jgi:hypothetical protein
MKYKSAAKNHLFLLFTSVVAGSTFVGLPSYAATFKSEGLLAISGISQTSQFVKTQVINNSIIRSGSNSFAGELVLAEPIFFAQPSFSLECSSSLFVQTLPTPAACNSSSSQVEVGGIDYFVQSQVNSIALGGFNLASGETFSFDFSTFLYLETQTEDLNARSFSTFGSLSLELYSLSESRLNLLDSFTLFGNLDSRGNNDFLKTSQENNNIEISDFDSLSSLGGDNESTIALATGSYSRVFDEDTTLILVANNKNHIATIPESSNRFSIILLGLCGSVAIVLGLTKNNSKL